MLYEAIAKISNESRSPAAAYTVPEALLMATTVERNSAFQWWNISEYLEDHFGEL